MAMIIESECTSTIVARTRVRALRITRGEMLVQMTEDPALAGHFISKISDRLSTFVDGIREIDDSLLRAETENAQPAAFAVQNKAQPFSSSAMH